MRAARGALDQFSLRLNSAAGRIRCSMRPLHGSLALINGINSCYRLLENCHQRDIGRDQFRHNRVKCDAKYRAKSRGENPPASGEPAYHEPRHQMQLCRIHFRAVLGR